MDLLGTLQAVNATLKNLFANKNELRGYDDWNALIGCVIVLDQLIGSFSNLKTQPKEGGEEVNNG